MGVRREGAHGDGDPRRVWLRGADRALPNRVARALLPDARLGARCRRPGPGDVAAGVARSEAVRRIAQLGADLDVPDRDERVPDRIEQRGRRPLPSGLVAESDPLEPLVAPRSPGSNPCPTHGWTRRPGPRPRRQGQPAPGVRGGAPTPVSPQRAVLILRDVLDFSAAETAEIIGATVTSVNSSLRRARSSVKASGAHPDSLSEPPAAAQRAWSSVT